MNKAEIIKGINMTIEGLKVLSDALNTEGVSTPANTEAKTPAKTATTPAKKSIPTKAPAKVEKEEPAKAEANEVYTATELNGMKYNEFKKLASSLGVDCKGTRDEIMARVVALGVVTDVDEPAAEETPAKTAPAKKSAKTTAPAKSDKPAIVGKSTAKKADAPATDEFDKQAEEVVANTDVADILEALKEAGVKANKLNVKKQLAYALREGLLSLDDEEGDEEEVEGEDSAEITGESYADRFDVYESNDPEKMSDDRAKGCIAKQTEIIEAVTEGNLSADDIIDFLQNNATQEELDLLGDDYDENDLLELYIEVSKHFVDDDGEVHEPGEAYIVNEEPYCCGQPLVYDDKTGKFICSHCAGEYDAE